MIILLLLISILPVVLLGIYVYKKDSEKEPLSLIVGLFVSGFLSALLVIVIDIGIGFINPQFFDVLEGKNISFLKLFFTIFFEIALVEEFAKWLMIRLFAYKNKEFNQLYDIIVYSVFVALGFALIENIFYVLPGGVSLGIYRALISVPGHVCFGVIMGVFLGLAKVYEKSDKVLGRVYMFYAILIPTILHAIFNFCLLAEDILLFVIFIAFIIILYVVSIYNINKISKTNKEL
jgi:RsiW-degrading membrane proteinase PrsW (M82 family)